MKLPKRLVKLAVVAVIGVAALVLNPWFGELADDFEYDAPELRAAVEGTWQLSFVGQDGLSRKVTFTLAQAAAAAQTHAARTFVRPAAACGQRSLVRTAGACSDFTEMPLEIVLLADAGPQRQPEAAHYFVYGTKFTTGELIADLGGLGLHTQIGSDGVASDVRVHDQRDNTAATLVRLQP